MKLTPNGKKRQTAIAKALKKGVSLAGLLSSLVVTTSCDIFRAALPHQTMGDVPMPEPSHATPMEQPEEPNVQPPQNQLPNTPVEEKSNASEVQSLDSPQITTSSPQLPIITDINDEQKDKILEIINSDPIIKPTIDQIKTSSSIQSISRPVGGDIIITPKNE